MEKGPFGALFFMKFDLDDDGNNTKTAGVCSARLYEAALRAHMPAQGTNLDVRMPSPLHSLLRQAKSRIPAVDSSRIAGTSRKPYD